MNIGQAASASGVPAKMIRYYESTSLIPAAGRRESNYRDYGPEDVQRLVFVRRARDLGFSIEQIRGLLALWSDRDRSNAEVRAIAEGHVKEMRKQSAKLRSMIATLQRLMESCERGERAECPIIAELRGSRRTPGPAQSDSKTVRVAGIRNGAPAPRLS